MPDLLLRGLSLAEMAECLVHQHSSEKAFEMYLTIGECRLKLTLNNAPLLSALQSYFAPYLSTEEQYDLQISLLQGSSQTLPGEYEFYDWAREAGKSGRKDAVCDIEGGRLIRKVRTGMLFLQSDVIRLAVGPCLDYVNQVVNFINSQYMTWLQHRHWLICHAAGIVYQQQAIALAGFSGGGKSTLMLSLLENELVNFLSNDRLFIRQSPVSNKVEAAGIAKMPRINPGTMLNNPRLAQAIPDHKKEQWMQLNTQQLWHLEEKHDVDIVSDYGQGRITQVAPLKAFLLLNWCHESQQPVAVTQVDLQNRADLLPAIMKSPGPFYYHPNGRLLLDREALNPQSYVSLLKDIPVYEVTGKVDFEILQHLCYEQLLGKTKP